ncbi:hypothetical protein KJ991_01645 [Patescibacteria group bacterium]|nr:hypothetical protein [Patescibacteria group bacterium]MBU4057447.1 hypothetical protein [Patescibacteria group bacterium]MBU4115780.1 hypothetical protein [Patescibacteria group bacterium]
MKNKPYISFVVTARNDNYGENLINRINTFIKVLSFLVEKHKLPSELVIVEYNPPLNKPRLSDELNINKSNKFLSYRFIEVPETFHKNLEGSNKMPIFEFVAKNIGIHRASGEFILSMNPDIILSKDLIKWIAKMKLQKNTFYRTNRHDITDNWFDQKNSAQKILAHASSNVFMVFLNNKTQYRSWLAWIKRVLTSRNKKSILMCPILNKKTDGTDETVLHERAAGDFLLMHRDLWEKAGGYDTAPVHGFVDGYILYFLYCLNVEQKILSYPIYHISHKVRQTNRPKIEMSIYRKTINKMLSQKIPYKEKNENWGVPNMKFKEDII